MANAKLIGVLNNRLYQLLLLVATASLCLYTMVYFSVIRPRLTQLRNEKNTTQQTKNTGTQPKIADPANLENASSNKQQSSLSTSGTKQSQQSPSTTSKTAPATTAQTPTSPSPTQAPACIESLKVAYTNKYNSDLNYAESYHDSEMNRIAMASAGHGGYDSSYRIEEQARETSRYNAEVAGIKANYYSKLASINC